MARKPPKRRRPAKAAKPVKRVKRMRPRASAGAGRLARAERRLRESEEKFSKLFHSSPAKIAIGTMAGTLVDVNRAYADFFGFTRKEMVGRTIADLGIIGRDEMKRLLALGRQEGSAMRDAEVLMRARDGRELNVLMSADIISLGGELHRVATLVDITERKKLEARLAQAQKMESVGRLAGGIAHDFNNILTALSGYARFVADDLPADDPKRADMGEVLALTDRAARLTSQLLAFSRRQILVPEVLNLSGVVGGIASMLKRLIGESIALRTALDDKPCFVKADRGQLEQVLLNLALNARDAMPDGGSLTFETRLAGDAVVLTVRDTGAGMTEEVKARAFEPFFTTKAAGKGSGLGLSMVHGIVTQSGGEVELDSAPGRGTACRIALPYFDPAAGGPEALAAAQAVDEGLAGTETVLLVEDEEALRRIGERMLAESGYTVLTARDGPAALAALARHGRPVDALITDVVMPGMSGRDLSLEAARRRLARRTLFISGYAEDAIVRHGVLEPGLAFLRKPFTREAFLRKLREVLDGPAEEARA
jgi:PAS domain S-box-containing protein